MARSGDSRIRSVLWAKGAEVKTLQSNMASAATLLASLTLWGAAGAAWAQSGLQPIRLDNWGYYQRNANDSNQWQYRPRLWVPYRFDNGWTFTQRADVPMIYTDDTGPAKSTSGYSGGIGNILLESIFETPEVAPKLTLRGSLRFVFPSPKGQPFGNDSQYQVAPMLGLSYQMPDVWRGVTIAPQLRYFFGFNAQEPNTTLVSTLNLFPAVDVRLSEDWTLAFYPENPITYNNNSNTWFVPLDFMFIHRVNKSFQFGIGGAFKLGNPSSPSYDYIIDGRATFFF